MSKLSETEIKYFLSPHGFMPEPADPRYYKSFLLPSGLDVVLEEFPPSVMEFQHDTYYQHPCFDIREKDLVLRKRSIIRYERKKADSWRIKHRSDLFTFKGKAEREGLVKSRIEREFPAPEGLFTSLEELGFHRGTEVKKFRWYIELQQPGLTLCLDLVETLGLFAELEILSEPQKMEKARSILEKFALKSGLSIMKPISLSYADLISKHYAKN